MTICFLPKELEFKLNNWLRIKKKSNIVTWISTDKILNSIEIVCCTYWAFYSAKIQQINSFIFTFCFVTRIIKIISLEYTPRKWVVMDVLYKGEMCSYAYCPQITDWSGVCLFFIMILGFAGHHMQPWQFFSHPVRISCHHHHLP